MYGQLTDITIGILAGACAWVYSARLTDAGMILNWWYVLCDTRLPGWIAKPLCTCYKCVSGQAGVWAYVCAHEVSITGIIISASFSIITSLILNRYVGNGETQNN